MALRIFAMDALGGLCVSTLRWCDGICVYLRYLRLLGAMALHLCVSALNCDAAMNLQLPEFPLHRIGEAMGQLVDLGRILALDHHPGQLLGSRVTEEDSSPAH